MQYPYLHTSNTDEIFSILHGHLDTDFSQIIQNVP